MSGQIQDKEKMIASVEGLKITLKSSCHYKSGDNDQPAKQATEQL